MRVEFFAPIPTNQTGHLCVRATRSSPVVFPFPQRYARDKEWVLPEPLATAEIAVTDGATSVIRQHGNPDGPRLVLCHGNGLATDLYYPFWSALVDRFDIVLYDLRNHGWSSLSDIQTHNIATFVSDNERIFQCIDRHFGEKTLRPASYGKGYQLRCPREYESCIFEYSFAYNFEPKAHDITCPIKVIGGDPTVPLSFLPSMDLIGLVGLDYDFVPRTTHFLQLEDPQECANIMLEFLEDRGVA